MAVEPFTTVAVGRRAEKKRREGLSYNVRRQSTGEELNEGKGFWSFFRGDLPILYRLVRCYTQRSHQYKTLTRLQRGSQAGRSHSPSRRGQFFQTAFSIVPRSGRTMEAAVKSASFYSYYGTVQYAISPVPLALQGQQSILGREGKEGKQYVCGGCQTIPIPFNGIKEILFFYPRAS